ncbi:hypothetical protein TWF481_011974 [Arthrobotrys musiformis]|uniref:F-box domain-containing protein n=1 Tax=Arthrobotrys musiformis TaxID=47236 RepID=A0AAV9VWR4_9PEZI
MFPNHLHPKSTRQIINPQSESRPNTVDACAFATLPAEIYLEIFGYLALRDAYNLLFTCKRVYPAAYECLWSYLCFTASHLGISQSSSADDGGQLTEEDEEESQYFPRTVKDVFPKEYLLPPSKWRLLTDAATVVEGWKYTKGIVLSGFNIIFESDLMRTLREKIESGELKPLVVGIYLGSAQEHIDHPIADPFSDNSMNEFFSLGSTLTPPSPHTEPPKIHLQVPSCRYPNLLNFPLSLVTTLSLGLAHPGIAHLFDQTEHIFDLSECLFACTNLRSLTITNNHTGALLNRLPHPTYSEPLQILQEAFDSLINLTSLRFEYRFLSTEVFIRPPQSVKYLSYESFSVTQGFWRALSSAELENVEWLKINARWQGGLWMTEPHCTPDIGSFAGKNLKYFCLEGEEHFLPGDMADCVLRSNPTARIVRRIEQSFDS